jgi:hypothetical protein
MTTGRPVSGSRALRRVGCGVLTRRYGLPTNTMLDSLKREGVELRGPSKVTPEEMAATVRPRQGGWTYLQIGEQLGVSKVTVMRRLDRHSSDEDRSGCR